MRRRIVATCLLVAAAAVAGLQMPASAYAPGNPIVVSDKQAALDVYGQTVSPPIVPGSPIQPNTLIEPSIAVNPGDHLDVVTDFQVGRVDGGGDADNGFGTSLDGGLTWTYGNLAGLTKLAPTPVSSGIICPPNTSAAPFERASDAVVTFGKDPTGAAHGGYFAYAQSLVFDDTTCQGLPSGMAINVSSDGGMTWTNALMVEADAGAGLNDKNWIVSDNAASPTAGCPSSTPCHHPGRTYIVWDRVATIDVAYCDPDSSVSGTFGTGCDKITNWSSVSGKAFFPLFPGQGIGTFPIVLNNGSLAIIYDSLTSTCNPHEQPNCAVGGSNINWGEIPGMGVAVFPSPPAPFTFVPVPIAQYASNGIQFQRAGTLPQVAYDTVTGDAVAVWEDNRFRDDGGATPGLSDTSNQNDAVFSFSTPVAGVPGASWSAPQRINQGPTNDFIDHWDTMIAIGPDGIWRAGYRQRYEPSGMNARAPLIDTYYQESRDQGATWTAPLKVNTSITTDPQYGAFSRNGLFLGDYQELAAGGNDETYVTRDESFAPLGTPSCITGTGQNFNTIASCQNQTTWVAHLLPQNANNIPDSRFIPAIVLVGGAVGVLVLRRRRRPVAPER